MSLQTAAASLVLFLVAGCQSSGMVAGPSPSGSGGSLGDAALDTSGAGQSDAAGEAPAAEALPAGCIEAPRPLRTSGGTLEIPFQLFLGAQPLLFGEANPWSDGGTLTPLNVRFYVTSVALLRDGAAPIAVDLVTPAGAPLPYGVFMFNAEDAAAQTARLLAPPGTYTGLTFGLGLTDVCNSGLAFDKRPPLSPTSQMTWPHGFGGYLFLRYEGRTAGVSVDKAPPSAIHMGGPVGTESALAIRLDVPLTIPASGTITKVVRLMMDQVFKGATTPADGDSVGPPGAEVVAGRRLYLAAPKLRLFEPAP